MSESTDLEILAIAQGEQRRREGRPPAVTWIRQFADEPRAQSLRRAAAEGADLGGIVVFVVSFFWTRREFEAEASGDCSIVSSAKVHPRLQWWGTQDCTG